MIQRLIFYKKEKKIVIVNSIMSQCLNTRVPDMFSKTSQELQVMSEGFILWGTTIVSKTFHGNASQISAQWQSWWQTINLHNHPLSHSARVTKNMPSFWIFYHFTEAQVRWQAPPTAVLSGRPARAVGMFVFRLSGVIGWKECSLTVPVCLTVPPHTVREQWEKRWGNSVLAKAEVWRRNSSAVILMYVWYTVIYELCDCNSYKHIHGNIHSMCGQPLYW